MADIIALALFIVFILGGGCSLAGTWWQRKKRQVDSQDAPIQDSESL